jgi:hypothetical protein
MKTQLRVGAAKVDISPAKGVQIAGDIGRYRPCTGVKDPIYARALVIERDGRQFCFLSIEVLSIDPPWAAEIRRRALKVHGFARDALMIHATQNHASPNIGNDFLPDSCELIPDDLYWLRGGDRNYNEPATAGVIEAIGLAVGKLTPVNMAVGRAIDGRVAFNRRYVMRDGTSLCQPKLGNPDVLYVEGPMDPEVGVVTFTAADGRVVAALLHHTAHPCNGFWGNEVIPDWPGAWCNEMDAHFGPACTAVIANGCCGNIITYNYLSPDQNPDGCDYRMLARLLAQSTKRALENMMPVDTTAFNWGNRILSIPRLKLPEEEIAKAKKVIQENPKPVWKDKIRVTLDWLYAVGVLEIARELSESENYPFEIQAVRIGNFALLALGGEPFAETQLAIKLHSPFPYTHLAHMSHGYVGYIPTKRAFAGGGYETLVGWGARLVPDAAELIERASVDLLKSLQTASGV